ncbi:MAG TPA: CinA family protein [Planctomycetaceae bacterium]|nr:CinA family protein [Planctomycetaceae bacterium]
MNTDRLADKAQKLAEILKSTGTQLVLAESCTAGLVASTLASVPGISEHFCGSMVLYQIPTKLAWLEPDIEIDETNVVSEETALAMAWGVLLKTLHATVAAAITGHLGPNAEPPELDGVAWIAIVEREGKTYTEKVELARPDSNRFPDGLSLRLFRQREACGCLIERILSFIMRQ